MIPILMYHQVAEIPRGLDPLGLSVPRGQFEQQMSYLAGNAYRCLTLGEAVEYLTTGSPLPSKSFVLTFDDGYQNVYSQACPILETFGFTATVFLVASRVGTMSDWSGQGGARSGRLVSWAEARDLIARGHIVGSHTLNHPRLTQMDNRSAFEEIRDSKGFLEDRLGATVDFISYPYSDSDTRVERLVESAGYLAACGGDCRPCRVFNLWRVPCLRDDTMLSFALKVGGWYGKRTALRESAPGRLLRRGVRQVRDLMGLRRFSTVSSFDLGSEPER